MVKQEPSYWLMKSEPDAYSIDTLKNDGTTLWDGIRNYQARNFMRNMNKGDKVFFYHSNCKPPGIVGLMEVIDLNIIDPTQFDKDSKYFDPKSKPENPRWDCVKVKYIFKSKEILSLYELKTLFNENELQYNITLHKYVRPHIKIEGDEFDTINSKYGKHLPIILASDPVSRYYNFKKGDIIKIIRRNDIIAYRVVK